MFLLVIFNLFFRSHVVQILRRHDAASPCSRRDAM